MSKLREMLLSKQSVNSQEFLNFGRNYQVVKELTLDEMRGAVNPSTKKRFTDADILREANARFAGLGKAVVDDLRPVSADEARMEFADYYTELYGKRAGPRMAADKQRTRTRVLKPGAPDSYLYRARRSADGRLIRSGPETYDFQGVDDGVAPASKPSARGKKVSKRGRSRARV